MNIKVFERIERAYSAKIAHAVLSDEGQNRTVLQPFVHQPIELRYDEEGFEECVAVGECRDMIRFTVKREGTYHLEVRLENGETKRETFTAKGFDGTGYIGVNRRDPRYFTCSSGEPFYAMGINLAFPRRVPVSNQKEFGIGSGIAFLGMRQYERWFEKCSQNGVNMARVWLGHEYFSPDTEDARRVNYAQFSKIDILLALAKKYGIRLKLTLDQFRFFRYDVSNGGNVFRHFNKNLYLDGKRCESIDEWMTEEKWKEAWLRKVSEFAKRYAGDTGIFAIELWNEMNCLPYHNEWNREMLPKVAALFPDNMVVNSLGSLDTEESMSNYRDFPWELSAFRQMHRYLDQGSKMESTKDNLIEVIQEGLRLVKGDDMPMLVAETGAVNDRHSGEFRYYSVDDRGILFVDSVYTPVFCGCAGCGNIWHWDERYVESKNLYRYFRPLADMLTGIDFAAENFAVEDCSDDRVYCLLLRGKTVSLGFVRNKSDSWKNVLRDLREAVPVAEKSLNLPCRTVKAYPIWEDDTTKVSAADGSVVLTDILYGTIFRAGH